MTSLLPELSCLPPGLVLDGELVAWRGKDPYFPDVCRSVLNREMSIPLTYVVFDLLRTEGRDITRAPFRDRRAVLESLRLDCPGWTTSARVSDGEALFAAVCDHGLEGVLAKRLDSRYRSNERGWVKVKNPRCWRRDAEREAVARSRRRRPRVTA
jgi:bifunctional non-homologous end joining protein LigD